MLKMDMERDTGPQIAKLSARHNAILDYIICNPDEKLGDVAEKFGVTQPWLSTIIHSDAFQLALKNRQEKVFTDVITSLKDKTTGVAALALDRLGEKIAETDDGRLILETADKLLNQLNYKAYSNGSGFTQTNNFIGVPATLLAEARARIGARLSSPPPLSNSGDTPFIQVDALEDI